MRLDVSYPYHWKQKFITPLLQLVAPYVVVMATYGATSDNDLSFSDWTPARARIQYKVVVLPVKEILLWR